MGEVLDGRRARQAGFNAREAQRLQISVKPASPSASDRSASSQDGPSRDGSLGRPGEPRPSPRHEATLPKHITGTLSRRTLLTGGVIGLAVASAVTLDKFADAIQLPQAIKPLSPADSASSPQEVPNPVPSATPQVSSPKENFDIIAIIPSPLQDEINKTKKQFTIFNTSAGSVQATDLTDIPLPYETFRDPNRREIELPMALVKGIIKGIDIDSDPKVVLAYTSYRLWVDTWLKKEENQEAVGKALDAHNPYSYLNQTFYEEQRAELAAKLTTPSDLAGAVMTTWKVFPYGLVDLYNQMPMELTATGTHGEGSYPTRTKEKSLTRSITDETYRFAVALSGSKPSGGASETLKTVFPRLFDIRVNMGFSFT